MGFSFNILTLVIAHCLVQTLANEFSDKVVIVTGGSSGIGATTAIAFARAGARVAIIGRNQTRLAAVSAACPDKIVGFNLDITKEDQAAIAIQETVKRFGKLDILVNNAGITRQASILQGNFLKAYDEVMNINLRAVVHLTTLAAPHLIKTKGNIINISGIWGVAHAITPINLSTAVSKAALNHFTKGAAAELAPHGVRVNVISPGAVKTDFLAFTGLTWDQIAANTPLKRISAPEEITDLILFLAGDKAKSITGSNYVIDNGGLLA